MAIVLHANSNYLTHIAMINKQLETDPLPNGYLPLECRVNFRV